MLQQKCRTESLPFIYKVLEDFSCVPLCTEYVLVTYAAAHDHTVFLCINIMWLMFCCSIIVFKQVSSEARSIGTNDYDILPSHIVL